MKEEIRERVWATTMETIHVTTQFPREGWMELVDRPEDVAPERLETITSASWCFCKKEQGDSSRMAWNIAYGLFVLMMSGHAEWLGMLRPEYAWYALPLSRKTEVYRQVGLALNYDF